MREILAYLKEKIPEQMTAVRGAYILSDPDVLPPAVQYPAVGLKDGSVMREEGASETVRKSGTVLIYVYVRILRPEASIMGESMAEPEEGEEAPPRNKGVLELIEDFHAAFEHSELGGLVESFFCPEEYPSEMMFAPEDVFVQRKGMRYEYEK